MHTSRPLNLKTMQRSLAGLLCFIACNAFCQYAGVTAESSDPSTWKTFVLASAGDIKVPPPPSKEQTKKELSEVKEMMAKRTPEILQRVRYWDAGSPAYRWNQIGYQLTGPTLLTKAILFGVDPWRG